MMSSSMSTNRWRLRRRLRGTGSEASAISGTAAGMPAIVSKFEFKWLADSLGFIVFAMRRVHALPMVRSNWRLSQELMKKHTDAVECAKAALPMYPPPASDHTMWQSPAGQRLADIAEEAEMSTSNMHSSPSAAAVVLFPASWRLYARKMVWGAIVSQETNLELAHQLMHQYALDYDCDLEYAYLQLAAATVHPWDPDECPYTRPSGYIVCNETGCHLYTTATDVLGPTEATFICMQDELDTDDQLQYIILTDDMACRFRRIAYGQPLTLGQYSEGEVLDVDRDLEFCSRCSTNWDVDSLGNQTGMVRCSAEHCLDMVHTTCYGSTYYRCPKHMTHIPAAYPGGRETPPGACDGRQCTTIVCTGLVRHKGTWCIRLAHWGSGQEISAILHPMALHTVVAVADEHIRTKRWTELSHTDYGIRVAVQIARNEASAGRRMDMTISRLYTLGHIIVTGSTPTFTGEATHSTQIGNGLSSRHPADQYPSERGLAETPQRPALACWITAGITRTLEQLQVYSEPDFSAMCERVRRAGGATDDVILKWIQLGLPLLPGRVGASDGTARHMHDQVHTALSSQKTYERAMDSGRHTNHWVVTQVDAVIPATPELDEAYMRQLGLSPVPERSPVGSPALVADVTSSARRPVHESAMAMAVRMMMNPSLHTAPLERVLQDAASRYDVGGAMSEFVGNEVRPIGHRITDSVAKAFRVAAIRSPLYGRVILWMLQHSERYVSAVEHGISAILASSQGSPSTTTRAYLPWDTVAQLCRCTNAAYVDFGCGRMVYWRRVLRNARRAYLFESSLVELVSLAHTLDPMPDTVHIVPCAWHEMTLDQFKHPTVVVAAHGNRNELPGAGDGVIAHYLMPEDAAFGQAYTRATKFMAECPLSKQCVHYTNSDDADTAAAYTHRAYIMMG